MNGDGLIVLRTRSLRQVTLAKKRYRLALELKVIDNGRGIPETIRERMFYPLVSGREGVRDGKHGRLRSEKWLTA